jgi:nucleotide-binding universal stress UspA family protein
MPDRVLFSTILVPTDGSDYAIAAGKLAINLARNYRSRLVLLYVLDKIVLSELTRFGGKGEAAVRRDLEETGRRAMAYIERQAAPWRVPVQMLTREGTPYMEIISVAKAVRADLIVIGQVGARGPRKLLIGSVTERVIEYAECPVLVAKMNVQ